MTERERFERYKAAERGIEYERFKLIRDIHEETYGVRYHQLTQIVSDWKLWQVATAQAVPEGFVVVKPALDSAAKYEMIGEYTFRVNDTDTFITVPWSMIKQIYKDGVECMTKAAQEGE